MPAGYRVEYGGQFESQQSASQRLLVLGVGVVAGLFMLLVLAFGRPRDALLIMLNLPLALIGGVAGVFLAGGVLSVASMIGFITLFGIATRNGIMLVSHIHHLMEEEGVTDFREAVERGARERLVPILMTAMAAGLALIPLALGGGKAGSEIQTPMAIVILCGLMTSTLLNMVVVPTLYLRYGRRGRTGPAVAGPAHVAIRLEPDRETLNGYATRSLALSRQRAAVRERHRLRDRRGTHARGRRAGGAAPPVPAVTPVATRQADHERASSSRRRQPSATRSARPSTRRASKRRRRRPTRSGRRSGDSAAALVESGNLLMTGDRAVDKRRLGEDARSAMATRRRRR